MAKFLKATPKAALLMGLVPLVFFSLSILFVQWDHTPEVVAHGERVRPGYETAAASYSVEASPHAKWVNYAGSYWLLILVAYVISIGGSVLYIHWLQIRGNEGSMWVLLGIWLIGFIGIFAGYAAYHGAMSWFTELTPEQYDALKGNLDSLFPIKK